MKELRIAQRRPLLMMDVIVFNEEEPRIRRKVRDISSFERDAKPPRDDIAVKAVPIADQVRRRLGPLDLLGVWRRASRIETNRC